MKFMNNNERSFPTKEKTDFCLCDTDENLSIDVCAFLTFSLSQMEEDIILHLSILIQLDRIFKIRIMLRLKFY